MGGIAGLSEEERQQAASPLRTQEILLYYLTALLQTMAMDSSKHSLVAAAKTVDAPVLPNTKIKISERRRGRG